MRNMAIYVSAKNNTPSKQFVLFFVETCLLETCHGSCCVVLSRVWFRCVVVLLCFVVPGCAGMCRFVSCGVVGCGTEM